jgi:membrane associated rhomboid family serine protease
MNPQERQRQPILNAPGIIQALVAITILLHFRQLVLTPLENYELLRYAAFIPARFELPDIWQHEGVSLALSPLTYSFLHADIYHLLLNMFFFLAFGTAVARRMSWCIFALHYVTSAVISAFFWMMLNADAVTPLVGASGALSGAAGALVRMSITPKLAHDPRHPIMPAKTAILFGGFWISSNLILALLAVNVSFGVSNIAWEAHIGGFLFGLGIGRFVDGMGLRDPIALPPGFM